MKKPEISVIIPVYNTEKYLSRCIDSVLSQSFSDFELILIDDGSTDTSGAICDEYAKNDQRIKVLHQQNSGVSAARNAGIEESEGEYLVFVDSDDMLLPDALYNMSVRINVCKPDILRFSCKATDIETNEVSVRYTGFTENVVFNSEYIKKSVLPVFLTNGYCPLAAVHSTAYRTDFVKNNNIRFDARRSHGEDWAFNINALCEAKSFSASDIPVYEYFCLGIPDYNKYYSKLAFSLIDDIRRKAMLCNKLGITLSDSDKEKQAVMFYYRTVQYAELSKKNNKSAVPFLSDSIVKNNLKAIIKMKKSRLFANDLSRKDKIKAIKLLLKIY